MSDHQGDPYVEEEAQPRRLGGAMIVVAWVVVLAVLSALFSNFLHGQRNPNQSVASEVTADGRLEVRLRQNRQGHYVASGQINGERVVFLLDTGATHVSVPAPLARRLRLQKGRAEPSQTANGVIVTYRTRLDSVQLGGIVQRRVRAHINPGMAGDEVLLGMSFLRGLELEQRDGVLTLRAPGSG